MAARTIIQFSDADIISGAEIVTANLLEALDSSLPIAIAGSHEEVVRFLSEHRPEAPAIVVPRVASKFDVRGWGRTFRDIARLRPRIFQLTSGGAGYGQHALLAATLMPGVRTVLVEQLATDTDSDLQRRVKRFNIRHLSAHLAPGEASARGVEALNGLAPGSVRSVINAVPDVPLAPVPRVADRPVIGSIGRLHRTKGFDLLIRAAADLGDVHVVLVGDGPERESLVSLARELGVEHRLHLVGWSEQPRDYLTSFDVFALPSRNEAYPLVLSEAMLARVPIVAARVGSVAEVVPDGEAGLIVEPDDLPALTASLRTLIDDPDLRRQMGQRGREVGLTISPERMARMYEEIYRSLL